MLAKIIAVCITIASPVLASDNFVTKNLGKGWWALGKRVDPFDKTKIKLTQIRKSDFIFICGAMNFEVGSTYSGFDGFSFKADIQFKVDNGEPVKRLGRYSTYLNGSDMVNDDRVFSVAIKDNDILEMIRGNKIVAAGNFHGWTSREVSLSGFTSAYKAMCD
jgi:hypothetical protein